MSPWLFQPSSIYHWQRERRQFILFISPSLLTFLFSPFTLFAKSQWSYDLILESLDVNKFCNGEGILQLFSFRARVFWHLYLIAPIFYFSLSLSAISISHSFSLSVLFPFHLWLEHKNDNYCVTEFTVSHSCLCTSLKCTCRRKNLSNTCDLKYTKEFNQLKLLQDMNGVHTVSKAHWFTIL